MKQNKNLAIAIVSILTVTVLAAVIWPLSEAKNAAVDRSIESDFASFQTEIRSYYDSNSRLPDSLQDIELSQDQQERAERHNYQYDKETSTSYELCAQFKTNTQSESSDPYQVSPFLNSHEPYQLQTHTDGYDCLEYNVFGGYLDYAEPSFDSFYDDGVSEELFDEAFPFDSFEAEFQEL